MRSAGPSWAAEQCMMGVDEAGRGPVLGAMVYGAAYCPLRLKSALSTRSFADSKTLSEEKRELLFAEIEADSELEAAVDSVSASQISMQMLRSEKISLNAIAFDSTVKLIDGVINKGVNLKEVYCDTVGDAGHWRDRLSQRFPGVSFVVCPKADSLYPIVSAASIVAKVTRDRGLRSSTLESSSGEQEAFGSGYPSDPATVAWLAAHVDPVFGFPSVVRFSWQTARKLLDEHAVKVAWCAPGRLLPLQPEPSRVPKPQCRPASLREMQPSPCTSQSTAVATACDGDLPTGRECDEGAAAGQRTLSFGVQQPNSGPSSGCGRHSYFQTRRLQRVHQF